MTKFVLHGGFKPKKKQEDDAFFAEILKDAPERSTITLIYFACDADRISAHRDNDIAQFEKQRGSKTFSFLVADEKTFLGQVASSDIIYFHGGVSLKILAVLKQYHDLRASLEGKIVAGDSAGANVFTNMFYGKTTNEMHEGLGFIPINLICHATEEYSHKLENNLPGLDVVRLAELETKVFFV